MNKPLPWFRFYHEALDDPKVQRLPPHLFKTWVNILCVACANGGEIPGMDDLAFLLRLSAHEAQQHVDELIFSGLIDIRQDKRLEPHNWANRQFVSDSSAARVRKHRQAKRECNVTPTVTVTPPDPYPESERDISTSETEAAREKVEGILKGLGTGKGGVPSSRALRRVAGKLGIADASPLVPIYLEWPKSCQAVDADALFVASAPKIYREASPEVRTACKPTDAAEPIARPNVKASPELAAALRGRR